MRTVPRRAWILCYVQLFSPLRPLSRSCFARLAGRASRMSTALRAAARCGPPARSRARDRSRRSAAVTAIVVDVVVRDRRGNPVSDLTAADFELTEDGVRQEIGSFTPVERGALASQASAAGASARPTARRQRPRRPRRRRQPPGAGVIALVFDRLTPGSAGARAQGGAGLRRRRQVANNIIAVFGVDLSLVLYQPFTRDARSDPPGHRIRRRPRHVAVRTRARAVPARGAGPSGPTQSGGSVGLPGAAPSAAGAGAAAQGAPPGRTRSSRRCRCECRMVAFSVARARSAGLRHVELAARHRQRDASDSRAARASCSSPKDCRSAERAVAVHLGDRRRQSRQRQHLSDGRRRPAHRQHAQGDDRRPLRRASRAIADGLDFGDSAGPADDSRRSRPTKRCCAPIRTAASACSPMRPAASSSPTSTIWRPASRTSTPTCATTTC